MPRVNARRGGKLGSLVAPVLASRQLCHELRHCRLAYGFEAGSDAVVPINAALDELYPDTNLDRGLRRHDPLMPRYLSSKDVSNYERGHKSERPAANWLGLVHDSAGEPLVGSAIPLWVVRAYDLAFGADGFLVDVYAWATALEEDQRREPPGQAEPMFPTGGSVAEWLHAGFDGCGPRVSAVLARHTAVFEERLARGRRERKWFWADNETDESSFIDHEDDLPTGLVLPPSGEDVLHWCLRNDGQRAWEDRVAVPVGPRGDGRIFAPRCVPIPGCVPGQHVEIEMPIRAPGRPGTYRINVKSAWPNGFYCYPMQPFGVAQTVIVPPWTAHRPSG